ncbi:hypothetical protein LSTR_LSTR008162 [Laodelphax striatellus]|uniref:Uncharacterized protein n=1 Tax=Laodelphax striatellus TaxID=195883 RepID=A0A482WZM3_LAOST|nr:hypothetical protein LSTR_LSTR008162 [Laodelphax striatellus]
MTTVTGKQRPFVRGRPALFTPRTRELARVRLYVCKSEPARGVSCAYNSLAEELEKSNKIEFHIVFALVCAPPRSGCSHPRVHDVTHQSILFFVLPTRFGSASAIAKGDSRPLSFEVPASLRGVRSHTSTQRLSVLPITHPLFFHTHIHTDTAGVVFTLGRSCRHHTTKNKKRLRQQKCQYRPWWCMCCDRDPVEKQSMLKAERRSCGSVEVR